MPKIEKYDIIKHKIEEEPIATAIEDFQCFQGTGVSKGTKMFIMVETRAPGSEDWNAYVRIDNGTGIKNLMPQTVLAMKHIKKDDV